MDSQPTQDIMDVAEALLGLSPTKTQEGTPTAVPTRASRPTTTTFLQRNGSMLSTKLVRMCSSASKHTMPQPENNRPTKRGRKTVEVSSPALYRREFINKLPDGTFRVESVVVAQQDLTPQQVNGILGEESETKQSPDMLDEDKEYIRALRAAHQVSKSWGKTQKRAANAKVRDIKKYIHDNTQNIRAVRSFVHTRNTAQGTSVPMPNAAKLGLKKLVVIRASANAMHVLNANVGAMSSMELSTHNLMTKMYQEARIRAHKRVRDEETIGVTSDTDSDREESDQPM